MTVLEHATPDTGCPEQAFRAVRPVEAHRFEVVEPGRQRAALLEQLRPGRASLGSGPHFARRPDFDRTSGGAPVAGARPLRHGIVDPAHQNTSWSILGNPQMLSFIAGLDEQELLATRAPDGTISSADLYAKLVERWLGFEAERRQPTPGAYPSLEQAQLRRADAVNGVQADAPGEHGRLDG